MLVLGAQVLYQATIRQREANIMAQAPHVIDTLEPLRAAIAHYRRAEETVALVPTMGALHEGHLALVRLAAREARHVVVSIFVNPQQFNSTEDFARYPRSLQKDAETLRALNVDGIFAPHERDIYPEGFETRVEPGKLAARLEGACRPGHFQGVATVVLKLFNLTQPDVAYFGQKDFQQVQIVHRSTLDQRFQQRPIPGQALEVDFAAALPLPRPIADEHRQHVVQGVGQDRFLPVRVARQAAIRHGLREDLAHTKVLMPNGTGPFTRRCEVVDPL